MQNLKVSLVQTDLLWENKTANLLNFDRIFQQLLENENDLIVLPEMFSTAFTMFPELLAEEMEDKTMQWMNKWAARLKSVIAGSLIIKENNKYYNRFIWMQADGNYSFYDKMHLFTMAGEHQRYQSGKKKTIIDYKNWRFCPFICYDLRFPAMIRNLEDYDCLIFVANWPETRIEHWQHLLISRAIENQSYVLAVNRIGKDGNDHSYNGYSMIVDPAGKIIDKAIDTPFILNYTLDKSNITSTRNKLPFLQDRDIFTIP